MKTKVTIIGAGFSGLSAGAFLAKEGYEVKIFEKNSQAGGRASKFQEGGFTFDMGPTWYWMPDVFEKFFNAFGKNVSDFYSLKRLDPGYRMFFDKDDYLDLPGNVDDVYTMFEQNEKGSSNKLFNFLKDAEIKYNFGMKEMVYLPGLSLKEYANFGALRKISPLSFIQSISSSVREKFKNPKLVRLLEFPVIFLGATPSKTPSLYSLMNYADIVLGTWYPMGGMSKVVDALVELNSSLGVDLNYNSPVEKISVKVGKVDGLLVNGNFHQTSSVVASGDYHHIESKLLNETQRNYSDKYWENRTMAPSALLFYLGVNKRIDKLVHHNLFFDKDFEKHAKEIYEQPQWPSNPAIYVSASSKTDDSVAPEGQENLIVLIPVAPGLSDSDAIRNSYYEMVMDRLEYHTGTSIRNHVVVKRIYSQRDFISDYSAYKGNAYGLANTLSQTAYFKPKMKNKKIQHLFYCGQLTAPGPGVPPCLISGEIVSNLVKQNFKNESL